MDWNKHYTEGRAYVKGITGNEKNACASCMSHYLIEIGKLNRVCLTTGHLLKELQKHDCRIILFTEDLQKGDIAFARDLNLNEMPDHVYLIEEVLGSDALIYDNYQPKAHKRNLGAGARTPFWFGIRFRD